MWYLKCGVYNFRMFTADLANVFIAREGIVYLWENDNLKWSFDSFSWNTVIVQQAALFAIFEDQSVFQAGQTA